VSWSGRIFYQNMRISVIRSYSLALIFQLTWADRPGLGRLQYLSFWQDHLQRSHLLFQYSIPHVLCSSPDSVTQMSLP